MESECFSPTGKICGKFVIFKDRVEKMCGFFSVFISLTRHSLTDPEIFPGDAKTRGITELTGVDELQAIHPCVRLTRGRA